MMTPSNLTSAQIRDTSILRSIPIYLRAGETSEGMIAKFKGDLIKTIQFLRERHHADIEVVPKKVAPKEKPAKRPKTKPKSPSQEKLF